MLSEWELWAVASKIIEQHGTGAREHAKGRGESLARSGDSAGAEAWAAILARIAQLEAGPGDVTH